jgi:hypothetical protein
MRRFGMVATALLLVCGACSDRQGHAPPDDQLAQAITKGDFDILKSELRSLQGEVWRHNYAATAAGHETAEFDPADHGYRMLYSNVGRFAVVLDAVGPQADGVRVRLKFGNLTTASINGGSVHVEWGTRPPDLSKNSTPPKGDPSGDWLNSMKKLDVKFTEHLLPGRWTNVEVTLPGTAPNQFGYMELSKLETDRISLTE